MKNRILLILIGILILSFPVFSATKPAAKKIKPKPKTAITKPAPKKAPAVPVEWAAKVNEDIISMDWFNRVFEASKKQLTKEMSLEAAEEKGIIKETKKSILEQIIEAVILMQWAQREGIEVSDKSIKTRIAEIKKTFPSGQEFHKSLAQQGMSVQDLQLDIRKQIIIDKLINMRAKNIAVTDEEIQSFYDKNAELYVQKEKLHLKQLFFKDIAEAQEEKSKLNARKEFSGEDVGLVERGQLPIEDDSALFMMNPAEISGIISGESGYYIFKLDEIIPGKETKLADVKESIKKFLLREKARAQYMKDLKEEKAAAKITINEKLGTLF